MTFIFHFNSIVLFYEAYRCQLFIRIEIEIEKKQTSFVLWTQFIAENWSLLIRFLETPISHYVVYTRNILPIGVVAAPLVCSFKVNSASAWRIWRCLVFDELEPYLPLSSPLPPNPPSIACLRHDFSKCGASGQSFSSACFVSLFSAAKRF